MKNNNTLNKTYNIQGLILSDQDMQMYFVFQTAPVLFKTLMEYDSFAS